MRLPPGSSRAAAAAASAPQRQQAVQVVQEESEGEGDEGNPTSDTGKRRRLANTGFYGVGFTGTKFHSKIWWREKMFVCSTRWDNAEDAARDRDRFHIATNGPALGQTRGLNFPLTDYQNEPFYKSLFAPGARAPLVGLFDADPDDEAAFKRLREFMDKNVGGPPRPSESRPRPTSGFHGVFMIQGAIVSRYRWRNKMFQATWDSAEEAGRSHDRFVIICHGPEEAASRGINFPVAEYEREPFYQELFGGGPRPTLGVHDPDPDDQAAIDRVRKFLLEKAQATVRPRASRGHGLGAGAKEAGKKADGQKRKRGRPPKAKEDGAAPAPKAAKAAAPSAHVPAAAPVPAQRRGLAGTITSIPVGDAATASGPAVSGSPVPGAFGVYPVTNDTIRFVARVTWRGFLFEYWSDAPEPDVAARNRDRLLMVLFGPQEAEHVGLNFPLHNYRGEEFFRTLFESGDAAPRLGSSDPDPSVPAVVARVKSFMERHVEGARPAPPADGAAEAASGSGAAPAASPAPAPAAAAPAGSKAPAKPALPPIKLQPSDPTTRRLHVRHPTRPRGVVLRIKNDMSFEELLKQIAKAFKVAEVRGLVEHHNPMRRVESVAAALNPRSGAVLRAVVHGLPLVGVGA